MIDLGGFSINIVFACIIKSSSFEFKSFPTFFNSEMESSRQIEARRQRLIEKAARRNKKSKRLQRKIQREIEKKIPNMAKVSKWQDKSAKHVDKGLRYVDQMKTLGQDKNDQKTEISFKLEKVCLCEFIVLSISGEWFVNVYSFGLI